MVFSISNSKLPFFFFLLFIFLCQPFHVVVAEDGSSREPFTPIKRLTLQQQQQQHILKCGDLVLKSMCSQNSKCIWCTSQDLDDTCFSKSEALRLPHQVFSCGPTRL